jgi:hypothetical protein
MALEKQVIDVQLQGLDTKTDSKLVVPGRMVELENARFEKTGRISKRYGLSSVESSDGTRQKLFALNGTMYSAVSTTTTELYGRDGSTSLGNASRSFGHLAIPSARSDVVCGGVGLGIDSDGDRWNVDAAFAGDAVGYLSRTPNGLRAQWLIDGVNVTLQTAITCDGFRVVSGFGSSTATYTSGTIVFATYHRSAGEIKIYTATPSAATLRATLTGVSTSTANAPHWDVALKMDDSSTIFVVSHQTAATTIKLWAVTVSTWASSSTTFATGGTLGALTVSAYSDARVFWSVAAAVSTRTYSAALANTLGTTAVKSTTSGEDVLFLTAYARASGSVDLAINGTDVQTIGGNTAIFPELEYVLVSSLGVASGALIQYGIWLGSKIYSYLTGSNYRTFFVGLLGMPVSTSGINADEQRAFVLQEVHSFGILTKSRLNYGTANRQPYSYFSVLPSTGFLKELLPNLFGSSTDFYMAGQILERSPAFGWAADGYPKIAVYEAAGVLLSYSASAVDSGYDYVECANQLLIGGGYLQSFDGVVVRENGFLCAPSIIDVTTGAGGYLADGTYSAIAVYERVSGTGDIIESPVSVPVSFTISGGGGLGSATFYISTYRLQTTTSWVAAKITLYVSSANGRQHYAYRTSQSFSLGDDYETMIFYSTDTSNAVVYTDTGESDYSQPDGPSKLVAESDRVWCVSGNDPLRVEVSSPVTPGYGVSFYPDVSRQVPSGGGDITALARLDGKLVAFKESESFAATGDGPDLQGSADTLSEFVTLPVKFGAYNHRGVVRAGSVLLIGGTDRTGPTANIWQLDPSMTATNIGVSVESFEGGYVRDSCFVPARNEAHFAMSIGDRELVYNTEFSQWSLNENCNIYGVLSLNDSRYAIAKVESASSGIYVEAGYVDYATGYSLLMKTGWINFSGIQGIQRIYRIMLLGELASTHTMRVRLAFDYESSFTETHTISSANAVLGSSGYQFAVSPQRTKCEAIQIEISDTSPTGESFNLAGLSFVAGIKRGGAQLRAGKKV